MDRKGRRLPSRARVEAMLGALAHRGPDDEQIHLEPGFAFGVRRLAIVDRAAGRQPFSDERRRIHTVCNGELFDHVALRSELRASGHEVRTRCDAELWPHLYEEGGTSVFPRARGQFAVAIWDSAERRLLLARDRFGICPLYYAEVDGLLVFASEVKGILASGLIEARADERGVLGMLCFYSALPERTCFSGVRAVPPGHYLEITADRRALVRYFELDFPDAGAERRAPVGQLVDELGGHLERAVRRRLTGDVEIASYLSGGLDSSVVLALGSRIRGQPLTALNVAPIGAGPDERAKARHIAERVGAPIDFVCTDARALSHALPELVAATEGPIVDTSNACLLRLARYAKGRGFSVVLTGEGADEAFAGYVWYKIDALRRAAERWIGPRPWRLLRRATSLDGGPPALPVDVAQSFLFDPLAATSRMLCTGALADALRGEPLSAEWQLPVERMQRWHPLHRALYVDATIMLPGHLLLGKGDRVSMRSAVEARYPFLDEDLVDFASRLAPDYKLRGRTDKWLLRAFASPLLGSHAAAEPKTMLRAERARTVLGPDRPAWVDELLSPPSLTRVGWFDPRRVAEERRRLGGRPPRTPRELAMDACLTSVLTTQLWHHTFLGGGLCTLPTSAGSEGTTAGVG